MVITCSTSKNVTTFVYLGMPFFTSQARSIYIYNITVEKGRPVSRPFSFLTEGKKEAKHTYPISSGLPVVHRTSSPFTGISN